MDADQKFIAHIDAWAKERGCDFVIDSFDGRESPDLIDGMAVDDVWGWMLPRNVTKTSDEFYGFVEWEADGDTLKLTWKQNT